MVFAGGKDALKESRTRTPYLIVAMGTNAAAVQTEKFVEMLHKNQITDSKTANYYYHYPLPTGTFWADGAWQAHTPNHGTMVLDLSNIQKVDRSIRNGVYDTSGPTEDRATNVVDSFCGFGSAIQTRTDPCGSAIGKYMIGCPNPSTSTKFLPQQDTNHGHTCIHDHTCTLSVMKNVERNDITNGIVPAPGWNLLTHPNAKDRWGVVIDNMKLEKWPAHFRNSDGTLSDRVEVRTFYQIATGDIPSDWGYAPENLPYDWKHIIRAERGFYVPFINELPIQDLWRHHIQTTSVTKFYLPLGVFLETYTQPYNNVGAWFGANKDQWYAVLGDPTYDPERPYHVDGMWPMCPHSAYTFHTDTTDAAKSTMIGVQDSASGYQSPRNVRVSQSCFVNITGFKECTMNGFRSYRIGMHPGYTMDPVNGCKDPTFGRAYLPVQKNTFKCIICTPWQPTYCEGLHECMYYLNTGINSAWPSYTPGIKYINPSYIAQWMKGDLSYLLKHNVGYAGTYRTYRTGLDSDSAIDVAITVLANAINERLKGDPYIYESIPSMPLYEMDKSLWKNGSFEKYDATVNRNHEDGLPFTINDKKCEGLTDAQIDPKDCNFDDNYDAYIASINQNMRIQEGIVVKPRTRLAYWTNKQHMISHGIPSWSRRKRDQEQVFLGSITDKVTQCKYGSKHTSVCSTDPEGSNNYWYFNPWLGGAFNVLERNPQGPGGGCDTTLLDDDTTTTAPIVIDITCQTDACKDGTMDSIGIAPLNPSSTTPLVCQTRQGQLQTYQTVRPDLKHNLCTQMPKTNPTWCSHPQGMLYGLQVNFDMFA